MKTIADIPTLRYGDDNKEDIKILQALLKLLGYFKGEVYGNFLDITDTAVKLFQKEHGLEVDGIVGPKTRAALMTAKKRTTEGTEAGEYNPDLHWKPGPYHPIFKVRAPYTHIHPYDFICMHLGEKEISGSKDNGLLAHTHEHSKNLGQHDDDNDYRDEVPYCSSGLNWTADGCGCEKTDHALARSWFKYVGNEYKKGELVKKGAIVNIGTSHVTVANRDFIWNGKGEVECVGFNQGNAIKVSTYKQSAISAAHDWKEKPGTVLRPIQMQAVLGSTIPNESTR